MMQSFPEVRILYLRVIEGLRWRSGPSIRAQRRPPGYLLVIFRWFTDALA